MPKVTGPLKWHGGKSYLANKIIALMPPRCKNSNKPADTDPGWLPSLGSDPQTGRTTGVVLPRPALSS